MENISSEKYDLLKEVLSHYDFTVKKIIPIRSAYYVETDQKLFCLKEFKHNPDKAERTYKITKFLIDQNFTNVPDYYLTREGERVIYCSNRFYYLTEWIDGREANFKNIVEFQDTIQILAEYNNRLKNIDLHFERIKDKELNLLIDYKKKIKMLKDYKKLYNRNRGQNKVNDIYVQNIDKSLLLARRCLKILKDSHYLKLHKISLLNKQCIHDSIYYQNILIDINQKYYIIDLDSTRYGMRIYDLGKLLRRTISAAKHHFEMGEIRKTIQIYHEASPISKDELSILYSIIAFPHKFWKLGKKRFINHKPWSEEKFLRKVRRHSENLDKQLLILDTMDK